MRSITRMEIILYVQKQKKSTHFYSALFRQIPAPNVPNRKNVLFGDHYRLRFIQHNINEDE
ncbi:hypothetical protein [Chryseobacterium daecheongense]|uniref:hypothetical protein n=1 Tax=Chryseobacterium daecheongense TaxID=192389 RepID=UPI001416FA32|nr:hypothetical protein [Chryseobacterium daecheongense]UOU98254.1 hypothetical protein MUU74_17405 [Chryseobacterium daecheongense]